MTRSLLALVLLAAGTAIAPAGQDTGKPVTRLFFQDWEARKLLWADVTVHGGDKLKLGKPQSIEGFKPLDAAKQTLVQMAASKHMLLCGVRDDDEGQHASGWILMQTGVKYHDHGDHGHWRYRDTPAVLAERLDKKQGNPAHLYLYDQVFYLANDKLNGYTRIDPAEWFKDKHGTVTHGKPTFIAGGGNHITLAVVAGKVGYSCWIDGGGPNKGKVDVTPIKGDTSKPAYSFTLPTGGIHGAITCQGKVFFAPSDGICWVTADPDLQLTGDKVKVHHVSLGLDGDKPRRTGAFVHHGPHVLLTTGKEANTSLVLLDARQEQPKPIEVKIPVKEGNRAITPKVVTTAKKKHYALIFHDHAKNEKATDQLTIVDLDPNGDGNCADATITKTLPVGNSSVVGHYGHHDAAVDADGNFAFFTNPGDGTISVLSLNALAIVATFKVGGSPSHIVAEGGAETVD